MLSVNGQMNETARQVNGPLAVFDFKFTLFFGGQ